MEAKEILARGILTRSRIPGVDYCVNPYVGCAHGCSYCYAAFMRRFTGHLEPWGEFLDAKVNAVHLLRRQLRRARPGRVLLSSVTDPYQPAEKVHHLTRGCLEALLEFRFPVSILTRSPLVLRDLDLFTRFREVLVDRLNYSDRIRSLYRRHGLADQLEDGWFEATAAALRRGFRAHGVEVRVLF